MAIYASPLRDPTQYFQYPSPTSNTFTDSAIGSEVIGDTKGRLLDRWNEIMSRIVHTSLADKTVTAMHKTLDEVDNLLSWNATEQNEETEESSGLGISGLQDDSSVYTTAHITPTASIAPDAPEEVCRSESKKDVILESQALLMRVTEAVNQLRRREEEFRHLHDIAIMKAEEGAQRILRLEFEVDQLYVYEGANLMTLEVEAYADSHSEEDSSKDQLEFTFLKLKLRMLEIQAAPYIPKDGDDGLREGIRRWKRDWADVDQRRRARRRKKEEVA
ncbi:MAG: hypothetical protein M1830_008551 [Pleopsidium flavum]|nr:MAG: hypothetical protein M1830_008551 [Pleopsidium flavum]